MNENKIVDLLVKYKQLTFIKILQQTMVSIFPFALIGTYCWALANSFLMKNARKSPYFNAGMDRAKLT